MASTVMIISSSSASAITAKSNGLTQHPNRSISRHSLLHVITSASSSTPISTSTASSSPHTGSSPTSSLSAHLTALAAAAAILTSPCPSPAFAAEPGFNPYYGTAASASSYGGYGGNASKRDTAEYVYDVPEGWKERLISKVEKGTNGTDSEFFNPKKRSEKVYVTFLAGFRRLAPIDTVLGNLALSDVNLQDIISSAEDIKSSDRKDPSTGQLYYDFEIDSPTAHALITVTCAKNKLYAHFVNAPATEWSKDAPMLRHVHQSFATVGGTPLESVQN